MLCAVEVDLSSDEEEAALAEKPAAQWKQGREEGGGAELAVLPEDGDLQVGEVGAQDTWRCLPCTNVTWEIGRGSRQANDGERLQPFSWARYREVCCAMDATEDAAPAPAHPEKSSSSDDSDDDAAPAHPDGDGQRADDADNDDAKEGKGKSKLRTPRKS